MSEPINCRLLRFNSLRAARGVGAAEVEIDGNVLWMTQSDIKKNLRMCGRLQGLLDAHAAYKANVDFDVLGKS